MRRPQVTVQKSYNMFGAPKGTFTTDRFTDVCRKKLGVNVSDACAKELFDLVDLNGSGDVDFKVRVVLPKTYWH